MITILSKKLFLIEHCLKHLRSFKNEVCIIQRAPNDPKIIMNRWKHSLRSGDEIRNIYNFISVVFLLCMLFKK